MTEGLIFAVVMFAMAVGMLSVAVLVAIVAYGEWRNMRRRKHF